MPWLISSDKRWKQLVIRISRSDQITIYENEQNLTNGYIEYFECVISQVFGKTNLTKIINLWTLWMHNSINSMRCFKPNDSISTKLVVGHIQNGKYENTQTRVQNIHYAKLSSLAHTGKTSFKQHILFFVHKW